MANKTLYDVCEQLKENSDRNTALLTTLNASVLKLNSMMGSFLDIMNQQRMDMLETMREQKSEQAAAKADAGQPKGGGNIAAILAGIAAIASGFLSGILDSVKALAKLARLDKLMDLAKTRFANLAKAITTVISDLIKPIRLFFSADGGFGRFMTGLRNTFRMTFTGAAQIIDDLIQPFKAMFSGDGVVGNRVARLFNGIVDIFKFPFEGIIDNVAKPFKAVFMAGEGPSVIQRIISAIRAPFDFVMDAASKAGGMIRSAFAIFDEGSQLMKMLNGIGRVIGRLFFPITLIMTAYDTIKGALAGYEDEGIIGAIQGAITGLINSVIGMPLDLLKSIVAWSMEQFGFDNAAEALRSFSFTDLISGFIDGIFDMFKSIINGVIEAIASTLDYVGLGDGIREFKMDTKVQERKKLDEEISEAEGQQAGLRKNVKRDERLFNSMYDKYMADGKITRREQRLLERQAARLDKSTGAYNENTEELERLRSERSALDGGGAPNVVVDASTQDNSSSSSSSMITQPPGAVDVNDPALGGA